MTNNKNECICEKAFKTESSGGDTEGFYCGICESKTIRLLKIINEKSLSTLIECALSLDNSDNEKVTWVIDELAYILAVIISCSASPYENATNSIECLNENQFDIDEIINRLENVK